MASGSKHPPGRGEEGTAPLIRRSGGHSLGTRQCWTCRRRKRRPSSSTASSSPSYASPTRSRPSTPASPTSVNGNPSTVFFFALFVSLSFYLCSFTDFPRAVTYPIRRNFYEFLHVCSFFDIRSRWNLCDRRWCLI